MTDTPPWRCETCKHWDMDRRADAQSERYGAGIDGLAEDNADINVCRIINDESDLAHAYAGADAWWDGTFATRAEFGCVLWEERP